MLTARWLLVLVLLPAALHAQVYRKGQREEAVPPFRGVRVAAACNVFLMRGAQPFVRVEGSDELIRQFEIMVLDSELVVAIRAYVPALNRINLYVTHQGLNTIRMSGAFQLQTDGPLVADSLLLECSGTSVMQVGLEVDWLRLELTGAGQTRLTGRVGVLDARLRGALDLDGQDLRLERAVLNAAGAGVQRLSPSQSVHASLAGAMQLDCRRPPPDYRVIHAGADYIRQVD